MTEKISQSSPLPEGIDDYPGLKEAKEKEYPWFEEAEESRNFLNLKIKEIEEKINKSKSEEKEELKIKKEILKGRQERLKILSSREKGAEDETLNKVAYFKSEEYRKKGKNLKEEDDDIKINDEAREELLKELRGEIEKEDIGRRIDINIAPEADLKKIRGIGPQKAEKIIKKRPFSSLDDIERIEGIGKRTIQEIKNQEKAIVVPKEEEREKKDKLPEGAFDDSELLEGTRGDENSELKQEIETVKKTIEENVASFRVKTKEEEESKEGEESKEDLVDSCYNSLENPIKENTGESLKRRSKESAVYEAKREGRRIFKVEDHKKNLKKKFERERCNRYINQIFSSAETYRGTKFGSFKKMLENKWESEKEKLEKYEIKDKETYYALMAKHKMELYKIEEKKTFLLSKIPLLNKIEIFSERVEMSMFERSNRGENMIWYKRKEDFLEEVNNIKEEINREKESDEQRIEERIKEGKKKWKKRVREHKKNIIDNLSEEGEIKFGRKIKVKRSSGETERDWIVSGFDKEGHVILRKKGENKIKRVSKEKLLRKKGNETSRLKRIKKRVESKGGNLGDILSPKLKEKIKELEKEGKKADPEIKEEVIKELEKWSRKT